MVSFLASHASGENVHCPDADYRENCVLKVHTPNIRRHPQSVSYQPIYPLFGLRDYSNYGLTNLILARRNNAGNVDDKPVNNVRNSSSPVSSAIDRDNWPTSEAIPIILPTSSGDGIPYIDLSHVRNLILSNNSLTVDELMTVLHDKRYGYSKEKYILKYLDLSHLNISWLPENIFEFFPTIEVLKLSNNPIRTMENITSAIQTLKKLEELDISGCGLQHLPFDSFIGLRIRSLNLSNNLFMNVPSLNYLSYSLLKLSLDNNRISFLDDTSFRTLDFIEEISAENCGIQDIAGETFLTNDNLRKLNLKNNTLHSLLPSDVPWRSAWINLENNPWDCSCRNLWLMRETYQLYTNLIHSQNIRCRTPSRFRHWSLVDVYNILKDNNECMELIDEFVKTSIGMEIQPGSPSPTASYRDLRGLWFCEKVALNLLVVASLLIVFAILLRKKCVRSSKPYVIYNILQQDKLNLDRKSNIIQHM